MRCLVLLSCLLVSPLSAQDSRPASQLHDSVHACIHALLEQRRERHGFPGLMLAYAHEDGREGEVHVGFADVEQKIPLAPGARMLSGSVGKTYVAAIALQLVSEGKLDLDARIGQWLEQEPWFARLPNAREITLRQLMRHQSGIPEHVYDKRFGHEVGSNPDRVWKPHELLGYVLGQDPLFAPGADWSYADTNYIVLGILIEKVSGTSFETNLRQRLLVPLHLHDTVPASSRAIARLVPGYAGAQTPFEKRGKTIENGKFVINPQAEWCGGGIASTALDLARWGRVLFAGDAVPAAMRRDQRDGVAAKTGRGDRYGLGVQIWDGRNGTAYGHSGWFPGYLAQLAWYEDHGLAVAVQVNTDEQKKLGPGLRQLCDEVVRLLAR